MRMQFKKLFGISLKENNPKTTSNHITLELAGEIVEAEVVFKQVTRVTITVSLASRKIKIKVPYFVTMEEAIDFARQKEGWIVRKLREQAIKRETRVERNYEDGAQHLLLGQKITLKVEVTTKRKQPHFSDSLLTIYVSDPSKAERVVKNWYTKLAPDIFPIMIAPLASRFTLQYGKTPKLIEYKYVSSYWGVCTSERVIRFNIQLLRAPKICIEYIIAHELCHLLHQDHSERFYRVLTEFMPDWRERKEQLEKSISCKD